MNPKICIQFAEKVERQQTPQVMTETATHTATCPKDVEALYSQAKRTKRKTLYSHPSSTEVSNARRCTFTSRMCTCYRA
jgi:hypothetical protein